MVKGTAQSRKIPWCRAACTHFLDQAFDIADAAKRPLQVGAQRGCAHERLDSLMALADRADVDEGSAQPSCLHACSHRRFGLGQDVGERRALALTRAAQQIEMAARLTI